MDIHTATQFVYAFMALIIAYGIFKEKETLVFVAIGGLITVLISVGFIEHRAYNVRQQYLTDFCTKIGETSTNAVYNCDTAKVSYDSYIKNNHIKLIIND